MARTYRSMMLASALVASLHLLVQAQVPSDDYPSRPITLMVPYSAGGPLAG